MEFCALDSAESEESDEDLMVLSADTQSADAKSSAIRLQCQIASQDVVLLLDSGSSHSFVGARLAQHLPRACSLPKIQKVRVAGGGHLQFFNSFLSALGMPVDMSSVQTLRFCLWNFMMGSLAWTG